MSQFSSLSSLLSEDPDTPDLHPLLSHCRAHLGHDRHQPPCLGHTLVKASQRNDHAHIVSV